MPNPRTLLREIGLTQSEIDVYLAMREGVVRVADIIKVTSRKRPTIYYALACLEKRGLVSKTGKSTEAYQAEPASRLVTIVQEKKKEADALMADVVELAAHLDTKKGSRREKPSVAFFEGEDAIKHVIMETLYCRDKHIDVVAPHDNFFQQIGRDFVAKYISTRAKRGIRTRSLWEGRVDKKTLKRYYEGHSEIRILPEVMHGKFAGTVFLYDDKTLCISSLKNGYCLLVKSQEHHDTMKAWFDGLWGTSKAHKV